MMMMMVGAVVARLEESTRNVRLLANSELNDTYSDVVVN